MTDENIKALTAEEVKEEVAKIKEQEIQQSEATVTSLAKEEEKLGKKVEIKPEEFFNQIIINHTTGLKAFQQYGLRLSHRGLLRVVIALLQMPDMDTGKMSSNLQGKLEKDLFIVGQKALKAKTTIEQLFAMQAARKRQLDEAQKAQANETKTNEQITNEVKEKENEGQSNE